MRALKIVMFTTFYPPYSFGGDAVGVQRMARALAARGHDITVVHDEDAYLTLGGQPSQDPPADGVTRIGLRAKFGMLSNLLTQQTGRPVVHASRIKALLDQIKPDIIWHNNASLIGGPGLLGYGDALKIYEAHEHWLVCPMHVLWRYDRELCDAKHCLKCTLSFKRPPQIWRGTNMLSNALDKMDLIVSKSEFSRDKHAEFGLTQTMTPLPYFLEDLDLDNAPAPVETERPFFLFVGRLEKIKGLQDVFPAFETDRGADLVILGDGDYASELKALAKGNPRIKFLGRKPLDELTAYYRGALGLIVPSVCFETFGIILIESFRLGTPVIARRLGPFPEIVETADGGALFETQEELIAAMDALQSDPDLRARQSKAARSAFETIWSEGPVLSRFGAALADAAERAGRTELAADLKAGAFENGLSSTR